MDVRDRYEAQQLERRRLALALRRGTQHESLLRETHPERYVLGGLGVALLVFLGAAVTGLVSPRAPAGWDDPGSLVLDRSSGQRYVVDPAKVLRPVLNETSLRLIFPNGAPAAVSVTDRLVRGAQRGAPVGRTDVPFEPPTLLAADAPSQRCQAGGKVVVVLGTRASGAAGPVLVRQGAAVALLTAGRLLPVADATALARLGYTAAQVVAVAPVVLETVPVSPALTALTVAAGDLALPPLQREGALVTGDPSGTSYVVAGGRLRALANRTAVQLAFGPLPPAGMVVPDAAIATAPHGDPVAPAGVPEVPPAVSVPPPGGVLCVDRAGAARVGAALPAGVGLPQGAAGLSTPQGSGLLLATSQEAVRQASAQSPLLLVTGGVSYPITDEEALRALGYTPQQVRVVSPAYAQLAPAAPALQPIKVLP